MKKVTLREYARLQKISYFQAMKMVNTKKVKSETVEENGKDVYYVLIDEKEEKKTLQTPKKKLTIEEENTLLKEEVKALKEALERCNRRTILA